MVNHDEQFIGKIDKSLYPERGESSRLTESLSWRNLPLARLTKKDIQQAQ
jgi:hypothetical protein